MAIKIHPSANKIPDMSHEHYVLLKSDIEKHGLLTPIELLDDKIIDGRHRQRACDELGIEPKYVEITMNGQTPGEYVWSLNGARRHLTKSQLACVAAELLPELKKKAKERQRKHGSTAPGKPADTSGKNAGSEAREEAAAIVGVGSRYVQDAANLKQQDPKAFEDVKQGRKKLSDVKPKPKVEYPVSKGVCNTLKNITAFILFVEEDHGTLTKMMASDKWDPSANEFVYEMVYALRKTLTAWEKECRAIKSK